MKESIARTEGLHACGLVVFSNRCFIFLFSFDGLGWCNVKLFSNCSSVGIYFIIAGIVFSGYKVIEGVLEDKRADYEHIEREGQVFLDRMEEERKRRKEVQ